MTPRDHRLDFHLLGPVEVLEDGSPIEIAGARQRVVVAILLLNSNRVVLRERLIAHVWGDEPPRNAANSVQVAIHSLRRSLGAGRIETRGSGYLVHVEAGELDVDEFDLLAERARREPTGAAARTLRRALSLWRGPALADVVQIPYLATQAVRLEEMRLTALEDRIDADLALARHAELVGELEGQVGAHPLRERLRGQLITALYRSGRQADALEAYQRARRTLVDELGIEPGDELRELQLRIIRQDSSVAAPDSLPVSPRDRASGGVPAPTAALVGRQREVAEVMALVLREGVRLVTLTGTGGTGKTRLGLAAAAELEREFSDGAYFVDLAPVSSPEMLHSALATALGVDSDPTVSLDEAIRNRVRSMELLILLDNFEHLADAAPLVADLLMSAPGLKVVVTSRVRLRVRGEHTFPVSPLALPEPSPPADVASVEGSEAVQLFVARAQAVAPGFRLKESNADAVAQICRAVDGLPLAIELAAARCRLFTPATLLTRFGRRLDALTAGTRDAPDRQKTMRATIDWSFELLSPAQQAIFVGLGAFASGADLDAVAAVTSWGAPAGTEPLEVLSELADASLITVTEASDSEPRIGMLETIRSYAIERLDATGEGEMVRQAHARHYVDLAGSLAEQANSSSSLTARTRIVLEYDNMREALGWALRPTATGERAASRISLGLQLCAELTWFWSRSGYLAEGRGWLEEFVLVGTGVDGPNFAACLTGLAGLLAAQGEHERARDLAIASVESWRSLADNDNLAKALNTLAIAEHDLGDVDAARTHFEEAVDVARAAQDPTRLASALANLSSLEVGQRNFGRAEELLTETLTIEREIGDVWGVTLDEQNRVWLLLAMGRTDEAFAQVRGLVDDVLALDDPELTINLAEAYAVTLAQTTTAELAARLLGSAEARREAVGIPRNAQQDSDLRGYLRSAPQTLAADAWQAHYGRGRGQPVESVLRDVQARHTAADPAPGPHASESSSQ